jgi:chromosome partitioning protein
MRILTVLGSKGGIGKSTIATNLLTIAALDGIDVVGLDLDEQRSLVAWGATRAVAGYEPRVEIVPSSVPTWRDGLEACAGRDLVVVDTPPGLHGQDMITALRDLTRASHLILIPALPQGPTLRRIDDVGARLREQGASVVFVLNQVVRGRALLAAARDHLRAHADLCPAEIPAREDVHRAMDAGMAVAEDPRLKGHEAMRALWDYAFARLGMAP